MFEASRPAGVQLAMAVPADCTVLADSRQLRQALWNLVLNAAQAMPDGRRDPDLRAAPRGAASRGGPPAPKRSRRGGRAAWRSRSPTPAWACRADVLERVFEPFFTTKRAGSGLGLPTVHRIVENHGGSLALESRPGEGTTVRVRLPDAGGAA